MIRSFRKRNRDSELMDDASLSGEALNPVLQDVDRANRMLGGDAITLNGVKRLIREYPKESYTIWDMGCGDGGLLRRVVDKCRGQGVKVKALGLDLSTCALELAKVKSEKYPEISFLQQDILKLRPDERHCDILLCTLTMHHFHDEQIPVFLEQFVRLAHIGVIINDLQRSPLAYYLFKGYSSIFIHTEIAKHDGLISIKSGFTKAELEAFARNLPSVHHEIAWKWAFRYVWIMRLERPTTDNE